MAEQNRQPRSKRIGRILITGWDEAALPRTLPEKMAAFLECEKQQAKNFRSYARMANKAIPSEVCIVLGIVENKIDKQGLLLGLLYDAYNAWVPQQGKRRPGLDHSLRKYRFYVRALQAKEAA